MLFVALRTGNTIDGEGGRDGSLGDFSAAWSVFAKACKNTLTHSLLLISRRKSREREKGGKGEGGR